jgi:hypothetical protein
VISSSVLRVKKEVDDPVLELGEVDDTAHFVGCGPLHSRFEEFDRDVPVIFRQI